MNRLLQREVYNTNTYKHYNGFNHGDYVIRNENKYDGEVIRVHGDTGIMYFKEVQKTNLKTSEEYSETVSEIVYDEFDSEEERSEEVSIDKIYELFKLNYSNTVHKYQGSQKKVVVFIASPSHTTLSWGANRLKLAYTAISRATQTLIILGNKDTFFNIQKCKDEPFVSSFMTEFNDYDFE